MIAGQQSTNVVVVAWLALGWFLVASAAAQSTTLAAHYGFDNMTVSELSPTLLERYVTAAKQISGLAIGRPVPPTTETFTVPLDLTQEQHLDGLPLGTRGGAVFKHIFPRTEAVKLALALGNDVNTVDDRGETVMHGVA